MAWTIRLNKLESKSEYVVRDYPPSLFLVCFFALNIMKIALAATIRDIIKSKMAPPTSG